MKTCCLSLLIFCSAIAPGSDVQISETPIFRADSTQVQVPTFVYDKTLVSLLPNANGRIPLRTRNDIWNWNNGEIADLPTSSFHIFEDGKEQKINSVTRSAWPFFAPIVDNVNDYGEYSDTPRDKWRLPDLGRNAIPPVDLHFYVIAYAPPASTEGSCHHLEVKVDRPNSYVFLKRQYCTTKNALYDPLKGTKLGQQMEAFAASNKAARIPLSLQAAVFYPNASEARIDITADFPWSILKYDVEDLGTIATLSASIGAMGLIYNRDGGLVLRFSAFGCCSLEFPDFDWGGFRLLNPASGLASIRIPTGYETQIDLAPGEYTLQMVISDGAKFGRAQVPLKVDKADSKQLRLSEPVLCKRFHVVSIETTIATVNLAPRFVPLISDGKEFTPAGDTNFHKGDRMFVYFEAYEPLLSSAPTTQIKTQLKISDAKTGDMKVETGFRDASQWIQRSSDVLAISQTIAVDKLPHGSYRLEVQAADSAGRSTAWRGASFTVE